MGARSSTQHVVVHRPSGELPTTAGPAAAPRRAAGGRRAGFCALGLGCAASGALGVVLAALTLAWAPAVDDHVWSYPFSFGVGLAVGFVLAAVHLMTLGGYVAVRWLSRTRAGGVGAYVAMAGCALLAVSETAGGVIGRDQTSSSAADVVSAMFGVASLLVAVGSIVTGAAVVRRQRATATPLDEGNLAGIGWLVLASGVTLLVVVTPANFSGDLVFRMVSLMAWSAIFVGVGGLLVRLTADPEHVATRRD